MRSTFSSISYPTKVSILGATVGIALIGLLATVFRRKNRPKIYRNISKIEGKEDTIDAAYIQQRARRSVLSPSQKLQQNGDVYTPHHLTPSYLSKSNSFSSIKDEDNMSSSTITLNTLTDAECTSPTQLLGHGLEALQSAITSWEMAITKIDDMPDEEIDASLQELQEQLHHLLARSYGIQDTYQKRLFEQVNTTAAIDAAIEQMDKDYEELKRRSSRCSSFIDDSSDQDSFVSALDVADLSDLDDIIGSKVHLVLYEAALLELKHGTIPCRTLRTNWVGCPNDSEFLAKLHCVRLGFQEMFKDETVKRWFTAAGKQLISDLLVKADRDPEDFQIAFDDMLAYVEDKGNFEEMEEELRLRGVKMMTFFDVVIDFILFDAFEDLEEPPSSVTAVVQNRWLSNGFKETALSTAVWSVLKAKRRLLRFPKGFIAHFYAISEHVSPVMAWGFLGPEGPLRELCYFFKDQVNEFMQEVFSFNKVRYTTVEQLADDLLKLSRARIHIASARLSA